MEDLSPWFADTNGISGYTETPDTAFPDDLVTQKLLLPSANTGNQANLNLYLATTS